MIDWAMMRSPDSSTKRAHDLGKAHDWVVVYDEDNEAEEQATVVTESSGALKGERGVRGREQECQRYYTGQESGASTYAPEFDAKPDPNCAHQTPSEPQRRPSVRHVSSCYHGRDWGVPKVLPGMCSMDVVGKECAMAEIRRKGQAIWSGDKSGSGTVSTESEVLDGARYTFKTRFGDQPGTNPEELIAAAHAGCFSMALAATATDKGYTPRYIKTVATCTLVPLDEGGYRITQMDLDVSAKVLDIDEEAFQELVEEADQGCPVSNLLRSGLGITVKASLVK